MSTTTISTGQPEPASAPTTIIPCEKPADSCPSKMGVASLATKRHLTPSPIEGDEVVSAKIAKLNNNNNDNSINNNTNLPLGGNTEVGIVDGVVLGEHQITTQIITNGGAHHHHHHHGQDNGHVGSTELVTTSILARTLLTSGGGGGGPSSLSSQCGVSGGQSILQYSSCHSNGTTTHLDPLESLKSSLEALPAPAIIDHSPVGGSGGVYSSNKTINGHHGTASNNSDPLSSFASLLGPDHHHHRQQQHHHHHHHHQHLANSVLSPIDPIIEVDPLEWNNPAKATPVSVGGVNDHLSSSHHHHHHHHHQGMHPSITSLTSLVDHQLLSNNGPGSPHEVITEDENGKSYFNLGAAQDSTILARKSSTSSQGSMGGGGHWGSSSCGAGGSDQQNGGGNDFDDAISSSSCDSISSEDLFNSGEEFDASDDDDDDDEDELCTYKQQRSTVLHLSLCKLNKFRTNCVEPSLHRSVLICNTLRHIEQEIRNEDAEAASNSSSSSSSSSSPEENLKSRERLPSFWPAPPAQQQQPQNPFPPNLPPGSPNGGPQQSQPQITDTRPGSLNGLMLGNGGNPMGGLPSLLHPPSMLPPVPSNGGPGAGAGHDPYLTPNPYTDAPYLSAYDYNSPRPTPFHTTSYDYEQDLLLPPPPNSSPSTTSSTNGTTSISTQGSVSSLSDVGSINGGSSSLLECDSGYSDADLDMGLSSYYYSSPLPPPPQVPPSNSHLSPLAPPPPPPQTTSEFSVSSSSIVSSTSPCSSGGSAIISSTSSPLTSTSTSPYHHSPHHHQSYHLSPSHHHQPSPSSLPDLGGPSPPSCAQPVAPMEITEQELSSCSSGDICEITSNTLTCPSTSSSPLPIISSTSSSSSSHHGASCDYSMASSSIPTTSCSTTAPPSSSGDDLQCSSSTSPSPPPSPPGIGGHQSSCSLVSSTSSQVTCSSATSAAPAIATSCCTSSTTIVSASSPQPPTSTSPSPSPSTFAQQDSQCGLESRRSDMSRNVGNHYNNHHTMPMMDSLISPAYSSSSL